MECRQFRRGTPRRVDAYPALKRDHELLAVLASNIPLNSLQVVSFLQLCSNGVGGWGCASRNLEDSMVQVILTILLLDTPLLLIKSSIFYWHNITTGEK